MNIQEPSARGASSAFDLNALDPVCGMMVDRRNAQYHPVHDRQTFTFCAESYDLLRSLDIAASAMWLSSVSVILIALRLRRAELEGGTLRITRASCVL
jgi:hypothetical protein